MNLSKVRHFHLTFVKECNNLIWVIKYTWVQINPELGFIYHSVNVNCVFWLCVLDTKYRLGLLFIYFSHHLSHHLIWVLGNCSEYHWRVIGFELGLNPSLLLLGAESILLEMHRKTTRPIQDGVMTQPNQRQHAIARWFFCFWSNRFAHNS